jgi:hypothetical protein
MTTNYNDWKKENRRKIWKQMTIFVDIDDTIARRPFGVDYDQAEPITEMIQKVNRLYDLGHRIYYYTARGTMTGRDWFQITHDQLQRWGCKFHGLSLGKPAYDFMIDDRTLQPAQIDWLIMASGELRAKVGVNDNL